MSLTRGGFGAYNGVTYPCSQIIARIKSVSARLALPIIPFQNPQLSAFYYTRDVSSYTTVRVKY